MGCAVEGRPADCVKLALLELLKEPPDLIVSGLNAGSNAGINVLYSGTVAAAIEGAFFQRTSIAVSLVTNRPQPPNFSKAADYARSVVEQIVRHPLSRGNLFNVNIPNLDRTQSRASAWCRKMWRRIRRRSIAASIRVAGFISGAAPTSAAPTRIPTPTRPRYAKATSR